MEMLLNSFMSLVVDVLNYQPLMIVGFGLRVFHMLMFYVIWKMYKGQKIFA